MIELPLAIEIRVELEEYAGDYVALIYKYSPRAVTKIDRVYYHPRIEYFANKIWFLKRFSFKSRINKAVEEAKETHVELKESLQQIVDSVNEWEKILKEGIPDEGRKDS